LEAVYSSPLSRARGTAEPLSAALGLSILTDDRLLDMSFGEWEGLPLADVERQWPDLCRVWMYSPQGFRAPGGESLTDVLGRAWSALEEVAERHTTAAVVSHRVVCKLLLCRALGVGEAGFWRVRLDTASVSAIERGDGGWTVTRVNDVSHLREVGGRDAADF
jgi:probable phosphoglycerate mutase